MPLSPGTRLGTYEIVAAIGRGGMGEVFRARDTELHRDVALKVLPDLFAADSQRLSRFRQEARILASLNHPNIASIYGIHESNGIRALVLELAEGPELSARLVAGPLDLDEVLRLSFQIAQALEAAHDKGVIHRDLKPANIKLTGEGTVKVLDFGLAKALDTANHAQPDDATLTRHGMTHEGAVMGTAGFMSPEQARGRAVDKRTDIWAFGCVVYEMLTGQPVFHGGSSGDTIAAILNEEPDWSRLPASTPPRLRLLLTRCLEKDARERLRDIGDARLELRDMISGAVVDASPPMPTRMSSKWLVGAAVAGAALLAAAAYIGSGRDAATSTWRNPLADATYMKLTEFEGSESAAAISPDGRFAAFRADRDGPVDIWLTHVGTSRFVNLTQGKEEELLLPVRNLGFSADGSEIWIAGISASRRLRLMPLMGGTPRAFLPENVVNVDFSRDGTRIAYHVIDPGDAMFVADRTGANAKQIFTLGPGGHNHFPTWSPDGRWIYFVSGSWETRQMDVWRVPSSGGNAERLTRHENDVRSVAPLDAKTVLYVSPDADGSGPWLWALDVDTKIARRASSGVETYTSVAASADGRRIVASVANPRMSIWSVPILNRPAGDADAERVALPSVRAHMPRFGGQSLFYLASSGTGDGLWRRQGAEALEIWKPIDGSLFFPPAVSPDGRRIALVVRNQGKLRLQIVSADGAEVQSLAGMLQLAGAPRWSPDGKWIVTAGSDGQDRGLFKIPLAGGPPVRILSGTALNPEWSPDGALIVYTGTLVGNQAPLLAVRADGTNVPLPPTTIYGDGSIVGARYRFLPDGSGLVYMQGRSVWQDFWLLDLKTQQSRQLTRFSDRGATRTFDVSPDGKQLLFDRMHDNSDIVLIERK